MPRGRISPAGVLGVFALVVFLSGTAVAANAPEALLGRTNNATTATGITNQHGSALALVSKPGSPPLSVDGNTTEVPHLDASRLAGVLGADLGAHQHVFATPGQSSLTVPAGVHHLLLVAVGGGGGGGGGPGPGGGGGQGGYAETIAPIQPGATLTITVGAGGAGGTAGTTMASGGTGSAGTESSVSVGTALNVQPVVAGGGAGGSPGVSCPTASAGGGGGLATGPSANATFNGSLGLIRATGANGGDGSWAKLLQCGSLMSAGAGGAVGFAGAGGSGGESGTGPITPGGSGNGGLVMVEFLA